MSRCDCGAGRAPHTFCPYCGKRLEALSLPTCRVCGAPTPSMQSSLCLEHRKRGLTSTFHLKTVAALRLGGWTWRGIGAAHERTGAAAHAFVVQNLNRNRKEFTAWMGSGQARTEGTLLDTFLRFWIETH